MKKYLKRLTCLLVVAALLISAMPMVFANTTTYSDFPTGWSAAAMSAALNNGLLTGFADGTIRPEENLTRAELATIITRAFGAKTTADISAFTDVPANAWFAPYIAQAVKMGALNGMSASTMGPDLPITREQVFTAVGRVLVLSSDDATVLNKFNDAASISSWAVPYMSALVARGYVNGDTLGNVNPQANITREEFAQFMYNAIRTYITQPGTYNAALEGITVVRVSGVKLVNLNASSDLVIGDGAGTGEVVLNGVNIEKRLLARGGTITVSNSQNGDGVVVNNVNGITPFMNYRTDTFFANLTENTVATFLSYSPSFGGGSSGGSEETKNEYTLKFYRFAGDTTPYKTMTVKKDDAALGVALPTLTEDEVVGYIFNGWVDKNNPSNPITNTTPITKNMELVASLTKETYYVQFLYDTVGNPQVSLQDYSALPYDSTKKAYKFDIDTYAAALPTSTNVDVDWSLIDENQQFEYWEDEYNVKVSSLTVTGSMKDGHVITLHAHFLTIGAYTVSFYNAYPVGNAEFFATINAQKENDYKVLKAEIPKLDKFSEESYTKDGTIASVYEGNNEPDKIKPSYWYERYTYVCKKCSEEYVGTHEPKICSNCSAAADNIEVVGNAELVPFDENVVVTGNMNVFCLLQTFTLTVKLDNGKTTVGGSIFYSDDTRAMDSAEAYLLNIRSLLDRAVDGNLIPGYEKAMNTLKEKLVDVGLTDNEMNIMIFNLQTKISSLVSRDTAEKMIKDYIRDAINNPDELEPILEWIDLSEFVAGLTNEKILELIHDNEEKIVAEVLKDLASENPQLLAWIVGYIKTDATAQQSVATALIEKMKNGFSTEELAEGGFGDVLLSALRERDEVVNLVVDRIKKKDSELINLIISYIKGNDTLIDQLVETLQDQEKGAALRESLLTSDVLVELLRDARLKSAVIDELLTEAMIKKAWETDVKDALLNEALQNTEFLHALIESDDFKAFILDSIHHDAELKKDVEALIAGNESAILQKFSADEEFRKLFAPSTDPDAPNDLRQDLLGSITVNNYIPADKQEGLLKYIFGIEGATNEFESFLSDALLAELRTTHVPNFDSLTQEQRLSLYESKKETVWGKVQEEFSSHKETMLDSYVTNGLSGLTDSSLKALVDSTLLDYINQYIEDTVPVNSPLEKAKTAIGNILIDYLRDALEHPTQGSKAEEIFNDIKEVFKDNHNIKADFVIQFIQDADNKAELVKVTGTAYDNIVEPLAELIQTDSDVRAQIASMLRGLSADTLKSTLKEFINKDDDESKAMIADLVAKYAGTDAGRTMIAGYLKSDSLDNATLSGQLQKLLVAASDEEIATLKSDLAAYIKSDTSGLLEKAIKQLAQNNDADLKATLESFVSGIDEAFVAENRTKILEVLDSILDIQLLKDYIEGVSDKVAFANEIFDTLTEMEMFDTFMDALMGDEFFTVTPENAGMIQVISDRIKALTFDEVMEQTNNATIDKVIGLIGEDAFKGYYEETRDEYCNGLNDVIQTVKKNEEDKITPAERTYTTSLTIRIDLMEMLKQTYEKAANKLDDKLTGLGVDYDDNIYLRYLVKGDYWDVPAFSGDPSRENHFDALFDESSPTSADYTGYSFRSVMDYYDYLVRLLIVADDALCWYGKNGDGKLSEAEFEAVYDAVLGKIYDVHEKLNKILEDYTDDDHLPSQIQSLLDQVEQLNSLLERFESQLKGAINKYLGSDIDEALENNSLGENEKFQKLAKFLVGSETPTININSLYDLFYQNEGSMQTRLQGWIDDGKVDAALTKVASTAFSQLFDRDKVYDILVNIAQNGVESYRVDKEKIDTIDAYQVNVADGISVKVMRSLSFTEE